MYSIQRLSGETLDIEIYTELFILIKRLQATVSSWPECSDYLLNILGSHHERFLKEKLTHKFRAIDRKFTGHAQVSGTKFQKYVLFRVTIDFRFAWRSFLFVFLVLFFLDLCHIGSLSACRPRTTNYGM